MRRLWPAAAGLLLLALTWWLAQPDVGKPARAVTNQQAKFAFELGEDSLIGPREMQVIVGMPVTISLSLAASEQAEQMHLHGYELWTEALPGQQVYLDFVAEHAGQFILELHESERVLARLTVYPSP